MAFSGSPIKASYIDLKTSNASELFDLWNSTSYNNQEGPYLYKNDSYYYLLIAEGGTELHYSSTFARLNSIEDTWESSPHNPLISARHTDRYFQTVGYSDLF
jgi:beta-xylosidase